MKTSKRSKKSPPGRLAGQAQVQAEEAKRRLADFVRFGWHVVEPSTPFVSGFHIDAICEHLEAVSRGQIRNLLINIPPRHMKSLAVSVFWPAWEWIAAPHSRWLFASYAASLSVRDSLKCRRLILSPWYQRHFGDCFTLTGDQNEKTRFENDKTGYRLATSVGGTGTGEGGDVVVVDDPHNVHEAESDLIRESTITWWDEVMSTRLNDPKTGARVIVMQRVHNRDLGGHVLEQGGYEHLCLPAEYEGSNKTTVIGWSDPRVAAGELLWPERFGPAELEDLKKRLGSYAAAGQLQQRPSPRAGGIFQRGWWRFYTISPGHFDEIIQSWDMTFKGAGTADFVAGHVWGRRGADKYLLDRVHARLSFPETIHAVRGLSYKWPQAHRKLVEDAANGPAVVATLQHEISGLIAVEPQGGKEARAHAASPQVEAGNVYLPDASIAPWVHDFIEVAAAFPKVPHDDDIDAMTQALLHFGMEPEYAFGFI